MSDLLEQVVAPLHDAAGWSVERQAASVDVRPAEGGERARRCTMKLYVTEQGRLGAFFYKRSLLPYSRNRYSYGHVVVAEAPSAETMEGWLTFVRSGFHPESRPPRLRQAAPDTLPD